MKKIFIFALTLSFCSTLSAQYTYRYDTDFIGLVGFCGLGGGSLTPRHYYQLFHSGYEEAGRSYSLTANSVYYNLTLMEEEVSAEKIDTALTHRGLKEAVTWADRNVDIVQYSEMGRVDSRLSELKDSIERIMVNGGDKETYDFYLERYNCLTFGLNEISTSYLANSQRQQEYLTLYQESTELLSDLKDQLLYFRQKSIIENYNSGKKSSMKEVKDIATESASQWKVNIWSSWNNKRKEKK